MMSRFLRYSISVWILLLFFLSSVYGEMEKKESPEVREYIIKKGDTLWDISEKYLKNPFLWPNIWRKNPQIKNPDLIYPGHKIIIPVPPPEKKEAPPLKPAEATITPPAEKTIPLPPSLPLLPEEKRFLYSPPPPREKKYTGMEKCKECHISIYKEWNRTIHARWRPGVEGEGETSRIDCEQCHGPGNLHVEDNRDLRFIVSFSPDSMNTPEEQNEICIKCHTTGQLSSWKGSTHGSTIRCVDCHTLMRKMSDKYLLATAREDDVCYKCHMNIKGKSFRSPHIRNDSRIRCSSCHNPHGTENVAMLWRDSINETCFVCHADKRGPYLYEHLPVSENCLLCHNVHGSPNRWLLKEREPFLCLECHTNLPAGLPGNMDPHDVFNISRYTYNRGCTNCHPMIHGSKHPSGAALQR